MFYLQLCIKFQMSPFGFRDFSKPPVASKYLFIHQSLPQRNNPYRRIQRQSRPLQRMYIFCPIVTARNLQMHPKTFPDARLGNFEKQQTRPLHRWHRLPYAGPPAIVVNWISVKLKKKIEHIQTIKLILSVNQMKFPSLIGLGNYCTNDNACHLYLHCSIQST